MPLKRAPAHFTAIALLVAGCATPPLGPTIAVMPAPNKPFDIFRDDDVLCRNYAAQQTSGGAEEANRQTLGAAAIGTLLGAGLGAAVGDGKGAGVGAAGGALVGTAIGSGNAGKAETSLQRRFDNAYAQCMYAKGNQVPGFTLAPSAVPPPGTPVPPR